MEYLAFLPNLYIIGAEKAGTSSLAYYLSKHPDIFIPKNKETHFFNKDESYIRGIPFYINTFYRNTSTYSIRCDPTPAYMRRGETVIPRIQAVIPNKRYARFIAILRDPVDRVWSHMLHNYLRMTEKRSPEEIVKEEIELYESGCPPLSLPYLGGSLYGVQINRWLQSFPEDSFLFLLTNDLDKKSDILLRDIFRFLNVQQDTSISTGKRLNVASVPRSQHIMKIIYSRSKAKEILKPLFPISWRSRIRHTLVDINSVRQEVPPQMPDCVASLKYFYADDLKRLSDLVRYDFSSWVNN